MRTGFLDSFPNSYLLSHNVYFQNETEHCIPFTSLLTPSLAEKLLLVFFLPGKEADTLFVLDESQLALLLTKSQLVSKERDKKVPQSEDLNCRRVFCQKRLEVHHQGVRGLDSSEVFLLVLQMAFNSQVFSAIFPLCVSEF